jgi:hypothetical protein
MRSIETVILLGSVLSLLPQASGQSRRDEDTSRMREEYEAQVRHEERLQERERVRDTFRSPSTERRRSSGASLRDRLTVIRDQLQILRHEREEAVKQGKTKEEVGAIDAKINDLRHRARSLRQEMGRP